MIIFHFDVSFHYADFTFIIDYAADYVTPIAMIRY